MSLYTFTNAYVECAVWTTTHEEEPITDYELALGAVEQMTADCAEFYRAHSETWCDVGLTDEQAGHNFWLTRNGEGTGFWDRGIGAVGDALTAAAKTCGVRDLYVGDDGLMYYA